MSLSKTDLKSINNLLGSQKEEILEEIEIKLVNYRSDLVNKLDKILKEILASREEQTVLSGQVSDLGDRVEGLEAYHKVS